jgi:hypothetical protein
MNIIYDAELTEFREVELYNIFRFMDGLYMKVPEMRYHVKVTMSGSSKDEYRETSFNAIRLNVDCVIDAYKNFAPTCEVKVLTADLVIRE